MFHLSEPFTLDSDTRLVLVTRLINPLSFSFIFFVCPPTMLLLSVWPFIEREFANIQDWSSLTVSLNVTHLTFAHSFTPSSVVHPANRLKSLWLLQFCLDHVLVVSVPLVMLSIWMIFSENKKHFIIWRATLAFFIHLCKWLFAFYLAWRTTFLFFFLSAFVLFVLFLYLGLFRMLFFAFTVHNHLVDSPPIIPTHTNGSKYFVPASREKEKLDRVLQCLIHFVWLSSVLWPVGSWSL